MSFTETPVSTIASLLSAEDKELAVATKRHVLTTQLLKALPEGTPIPAAVYSFGYCADAALRFSLEAPLTALLKLYAPVPLVDIRGSSQSQKPRSYLRNQDLQDTILDIYPVIVKTEGLGRHQTTQARWWTSLDGLHVEVLAAIDSASQFKVDLDKFEACSHHYSTGSTQFFVQRVEVLKGSRDAEQLWYESWTDYIGRNAFRMNQKSFVNAMRATVERNPEKVLTRADLPEPYRAAQTTEPIVRKEHVWDRIGDFSAAFDSTQVDDLLAFARVQAQAYPAALAKAQAQSDQVVAWLTKYFSAHGRINNSVNANLVRRVEQLCRRDTGLQVHLTFLGRDCQNVFATYRIGETDSHAQLLPCAQGLPSLKAQDICVTYV